MNKIKVEGHIVGASVLCPDPAMVPALQTFYTRIFHRRQGTVGVNPASWAVPIHATSIEKYCGRMPDGSTQDGLKKWNTIRSGALGEYGGPVHSPGSPSTKTSNPNVDAKTAASIAGFGGPSSTSTDGSQPGKGAGRSGSAASGGAKGKVTAAFSKLAERRQSAMDATLNDRPYGTSAQLPPQQPGFFSTFFGTAADPVTGHTGGSSGGGFAGGFFGRGGPRGEQCALWVPHVAIKQSALNAALMSKDLSVVATLSSDVAIKTGSQVVASASDDDAEPCPFIAVEVPEEGYPHPFARGPNSAPFPQQPRVCGTVNDLVVLPANVDKTRGTAAAFERAFEWRAGHPRTIDPTFSAASETIAMFHGYPGTHQNRFQMSMIAPRDWILGPVAVGAKGVPQDTLMPLVFLTCATKELLLERVGMALELGSVLRPVRTSRDGRTTAVITDLFGGVVGLCHRADPWDGVSPHGPVCEDLARCEPAMRYELPTAPVVE